MPKAFIIADVKTTNMEQMLKYREWSAKALAEHSVKVLARGGAIEVLEGQWQPERVVMFEFDSVEKARAYYNSEAYGHARKVREGAGVLNMIIVEGVA
jgi:uncharacterized protein (DUF1330 family)